MSWRSVDRRALLLLQGESLAEHGGASGLRDEGLLDSALALPHHLLTHADAGAPPDTAALATACASGLVRNHPFVDGNKPAAFLAAGLFLALNGWRLTATQAQATVAVLDLASGDLPEAEFAQWLRGHIVPR
jgi:death-on-curing protein